MMMKVDLLSFLTQLDSSKPLGPKDIQLTKQLALIKTGTISVSGKFINSEN